MKIRTVALAVAALAMLPAAQAQQSFKAGDLLVRGRILYMDVANKDTIPGLEVDVNNKTFPEVDFTYFLSPNLALELILTYPQKHDVKADGSKIGTLKHLPPTLSVQYHFPLGAFKPYVGAGLNYTRFMSVDLPDPLSVDKNSFGLSLQAGADYAIDSKWSLNVDLKKVQIRTDLKAGDTKLGKVKVDPMLFSVGVGYKF